jgi:hypothetical protein
MPPLARTSIGDGAATAGGEVVVVAAQAVSANETRQARMGLIMGEDKLAVPGTTEAPGPVQDEMYGIDVFSGVIDKKSFAVQRCGTGVESATR